MLGTDQYRNISIETSDEPRTGKGSISISQTMHQGYRVFGVYKLVMLVLMGPVYFWRLVTVLVSVCTKYNEPMLLHATMYICQQDKYKVDVCMQRFAIRLSRRSSYA